MRTKAKAKLTKTQKSISVPKDFFKKFDELYQETKDICNQLEISSTSKLVRVLANLGETRFLRIIESIRKGNIDPSQIQLERE